MEYNKPIHADKNAVAIRIRHEAMGIWDSRYKRRTALVNTTPPTAEEWAEYKKASEALDYLIQSPYFDDGISEEGPSVNQPQPKHEYRYTETETEWHTRCAKLDKERRH